MESSKKTLPHYLPLGVPFVKEIVFNNPTIKADPDTIYSFTLNGILFTTQWQDPLGVNTVLANSNNTQGLCHAFADAVNGIAKSYDSLHNIEEPICACYARVVGGRLFLIGRKPGDDFTLAPSTGIQDPAPTTVTGTSGPIGDCTDAALPDGTLTRNDPPGTCHSMITLLKSIQDNTQEIEFTVEPGGVINVLLTELEARVGDETSAAELDGNAASANLNSLTRGILLSLQTPVVAIGTFTGTSGAGVGNGVNFEPLPTIAATSFRFVNRTGVAIELQTVAGGGPAEPLLDGESASYPCVANMDEWEVRRVDQADATVTFVGVVEQ